MHVSRAVAVVIALASLGFAWQPQLAWATACARTEFEAVVDQASATLVQLNQKNTPAFQARLRALKDKRGWSHDQFIKEGAPFVRDDTIAGLDDKSQQLLIKINTQGNSDGADCKVLDELRAAMGSLVETQNAKWTYMFEKIDKAMAQ
jgi:predicted dithiol-disulfide oxidoreductase (DUF899 family)